MQVSSDLAFQTLYEQLWETYTPFDAGKLILLRAAAATAMSAATDTVTITGASFEGGNSTTGIATFDQMLFLAVCRQLLRDYDVANVAPIGDAVVQVSFAGRQACL